MISSYEYMSRTTITRNFQVTIPKEIRRALALKLGDKLAVHVEDDKIVLEKITDESWEECTGFLPDDFETIQRRIRQDATDRFKRLGLL